MNKRFLSTLLTGAFFLAATSMFVSCKDYDDDISAVKADVTALRTELSSVKTNLEGELATVKASLATATTDITDLKARVAVLEAQISAANTALATLQDDVKGASATLAALTGKVDDEAATREAADKNLQIQIDALNKFMASVTDAKYQEQIDALKKQLAGVETSANLDQLKADLKKAQEAIASVNSNLDALTVLIERQLNSIALVPELYVGGIEAIEFLSLQYTPVKPGTSGLTPAAGATAIRIDNGETDATYRLNPTTVQRDGIDEANIDFVAAIAETRAANVLETSPVKFNGIKEYKNGLMTVKIKKNTTASLNLTGNNIYIVSLKVPRNADKYEAADVYSENSRLVETTISPKIASLTWSVNGYNTNGEVRPHHYSDSASIWGSRVDATPLALVAKKIFYKNTFNLNEIVTGCYISSNSHNQITKDDLKSYGLTFRYAIPTKTYNNGADNATDQQQFAVVTPQGIISAKTPAGVTDNEAVVGKEPIVRVMLVDTLNNKLVDERYMKVKWVLNELDAVKLADKKSEATLSCNDVKAEFKWDEFVNEVYAKARVEGLSQAKFKTIYGDNPTITAKGWTVNWNPTTATSADATGTDATAIPVWQSTTNENGDALVGTWTLSPDQIQTVYASAASDTKTFKAEVKFKSGSPSEYPDLYFDWYFTIKLPTLPSINGYYDQYWLDNQVGQAHDVLPVQYNTAAQTRDYCVFDNNLMNAFTYELKNGVRQFIVKDIPECGTWDLQFRYEQTLTGYAPNYKNTDADAWKSANQWTNKAQEAYDAFGAYQFVKGTDKALQLNWDDGHSSWCGNPAHKTANLFADHNVVANQGLLNPLGQNDIVGGDGTKTPERTHTKPIDVTIWATLNAYNYIPVLNYKIYLVEPIRINQTELGNFQDGVVSGDILDWTKAFTLTDFRGYLVAEVAPDPDVDANGVQLPLPEQKNYAPELWEYYEITEVTIDEDNIKYAFKRQNGSVVIDNNLTYANSMTAEQISDETNGNIVLSMTRLNENLVFKNNGGSNIEAKVKAYIPVTVKYGFGTLNATLVAWIYPHGQKPAAN